MLTRETSKIANALFLLAAAAAMMGAPRQALLRAIFIISAAMMLHTQTVLGSHLPGESVDSPACASVHPGGRYDANRRTCVAPRVSESACAQIPGMVRWHRDMGHGAHICDFAVPSSASGRPRLPGSEPAPAPSAPRYDPEVERRNRAIEEERERVRAAAEHARTEYDRSRETSNRGADDIANMLRDAAREAGPPTETPRGQSDSPRQAAAGQGLSCFSLASDDKKWLGQDSVIASNDCDKSVMVKVCFRGTQACSGDTVPPGRKSRIANMNEGGSTSIRYWTCVKADYDAGRCRLP